LTRKKAGFPVPYGAWLRHDLKEMVADTLLSQRARERGYFDRQAIERVLSTNSTEYDQSKLVFSLTVLELWSQSFLDLKPVGVPA
jgi:asparagine synthase (glutamine-hydrolysing)